jgi:F-type H+/Na+-transporting ATPase subunit beta
MSSESNKGQVISIRGSVVDAFFPRRLPSLYSVLLTGENSDIVMEVVSHLDSQIVRGIALTSTRGLAVRDSVIDTGEPLKVPVGDKIRGRVFNVFGRTIDGKGDITDCELRSIHRDPVPLNQQNTSSEVFETGIKIMNS